MQTARDYLDDEPGEYRRQCEMIREEKRRRPSVQRNWMTSGKRPSAQQVGCPARNSPPRAFNTRSPGIAKADNGGLF